MHKRNSGIGVSGLVLFQTNKSKLTSLRAVNTAALPEPSQMTDRTDHRCTDSAACFWHHKTEAVQMLSFKEEAAVSARCLKRDGICDISYSMETIQADTQSPLKNCTYQSVYMYCKGVWIYSPEKNSQL